MPGSGPCDGDNMSPVKQHSLSYVAYYVYYVAFYIISELLLILTYNSKSFLGWAARVSHFIYILQ